MRKAVINSQPETELFDIFFKPFEFADEIRFE